LEDLEIKQEIKIETISLVNYRFFCGDEISENNTLYCNGNNVLIYGENGTGKSSVYKAIELLVTKKFSSLAKEGNIFNPDNTATIEFKFSNGHELILSRDLEKIPEGMEYLENLSIFSPLLHYKKLLRVHYASNGNGKPINLFALLVDLFKDFPLENGQRLSDITDTGKYFIELQRILNEIVLDYTNQLLKEFDTDITIQKFIYRGELTEDKQQTVNIINAEIDFKERTIDSFHTFLNEGRLSSLAISLYFAAIKIIHSKLSVASLKILVLDDILLSFDFSNRVKLNEILEKEFSDFQIFFFTHEKTIYDAFKNNQRILWEQIELYEDVSNENPIPIIKKGTTFFERANEFLKRGTYDACANSLRKEAESICKNYLLARGEEIKGSLNSHLYKIRTLNLQNQSIIQKIDKVLIYKDIVLNAGSHTGMQLYRQEIMDCMTALKNLKQVLK
ncbi:MAG: hypothetical protein KDK45_21895, partial [Leptospiraceae bacterium]|nr:hypothetical protein [Leptospiraceae bacterium]